MRRPSLSMIRFSLLCAALLALVEPAGAQGGPLVLTLDEAIQIALERNYTIRSAELDVATANAQISEAYGSLFPQVDLTSSYTRNVISPNPFAGTDVASIFGGTSTDWLEFNENARVDADPDTVPITLQEFLDRQEAGQAAAGIETRFSDNPFAVPNVFQNGISLSQTLYSGSAFAAVKGARGLREINEAALEQQQDEVIHQTRQLFYGALLAQEQVNVLEASVARTRETVQETSLLVAQGVAPMLQRLQAEVQLANQQTQLIQSRTAAGGARDQLLFVLGLPVDRPITLHGVLEVPEDEAPYRRVGLLDAVATALDERPDVEQARLAIKLQEVNRNITRAASLPEVSAFANYGFNGNVPDDRTVVTQTGDFEFEASSNGFFDGSYWDPSLSVGIRLNWTIFDGFQTRRRVQQNTIAIEQAEIQHQQVQEAAKLDVAQTLREMEGAEQRVNAQQQNVATANLAFDFAFERLRNGVGTQLDVRQASDNLDQSRLLQLQAIHDYLVARSDIERATGTISAVAN